MPTCATYLPSCRRTRQNKKNVYCRLSWLDRYTDTDHRCHETNLRHPHLPSLPYLWQAMACQGGRRRDTGNDCVWRSKAPARWATDLCRHRQWGYYDVLPGLDRTMTRVWLLIKPLCEVWRKWVFSKGYKSVRKEDKGVWLQRQSLDVGDMALLTLHIWYLCFSSMSHDQRTYIGWQALDIDRKWIASRDGWGW